MPCLPSKRALSLIALLGFAGCATPPSVGGYFDIEGRSVADATRGVRGVLVEHVGTAAPGLEAGDVILRIDERDVSTYGDLLQTAFDTGANQMVSVDILRGHERRDVTVRTVPAEERRHVGFGLPLLQSPLTFETGGLGLDSLVDVEVGPDERGIMILRLLGFESGPRGWDARLLIFHFGCQIRPSDEGVGSKEWASMAATSGTGGEDLGLAVTSRTESR